MLTGDEVKAARARARLTQEQAAQAAGVTPRTWGTWERTPELAPGNEARVRQVLGSHLAGEGPSLPLADVSDAQLLAEIAARFDRGRRADHGAATTRAGGSPAPAPRNPLEAAAEAVLDLVSPEAAEAARSAERTMTKRAERTRKQPG